MTLNQSSLSYAVRLPVIAKYIGQLLIIEAVLTLAPLAVALSYGEYEAALRYFLVMIFILLIAIPTTRIPSREQIQANEALVIVALAFLLSPLLMLYPMSAAGLSMQDTLFEAISAITTTGLTTISDVESKSHSFLFVRAWMQWYGGLGIVVLSIALLIRHQLAARRLAETIISDDLVTTSRIYARRMLSIYFTLTLGGFLIIFATNSDWFTALTHTLAAISTGGFSTYNNSLASFENPASAYAVTILSILGAIPLSLYYLVVHKNWRIALNDIELRALLAMGIASTIILGYSIYLTSGWNISDVISHALIIGFSAQTTAGFSSMNISELSDASKTVLMGSMFIGGGVGSTAGGVKLLRLLILLRLIQVILQRTAMPVHAVSNISLVGKPLEADDIQRALLLILLFVFVILLSWLLFLAFGYPPLDSLFEIVSATATVGLSTGITSPDLHPVLKAVLCVDMLLGRLEIVALLVVLYPPTWFGKRMTT